MASFWNLVFGSQQSPSDSLFGDLSFTGSVVVIEEGTIDALLFEE